MKAEEITLLTLLGDDVQFVVPPFQRGYSWEEHPHWEMLWLDIESLLNTPEKRHFLGAIILQHIDSDSPIHRYDVIDGQQRIATLQALLLAFAHYAERHGYKRLEARARKCTSNDDPNIVFQPKLVPALRDKSDYEGIFKQASNKGGVSLFSEMTNDANSDKTLRGAFDFFLKKIDTVFRDDNSSKKKEDTGIAKRFVEILKDDLLLVRISLDEKDNAQEIFESLNARGATLNPSAMIKNDILRFSTTDGKSQTELYNNYWKPFDDKQDDEESNFWEKDMRVGTFSLTVCDHFFSSYYVYLREEAVLLRRTHKAFETNILADLKKNEDPKKRYALAEEILSAIGDKRDLYRSLSEGTSVKEFNRFAEYMDALGYTTLFPVLFILYDIHLRTCGGETARVSPQLQHTLHMLESMLFRRAFSFPRTLDHERFSAKLVRKIRKQQDDYSNIDRVVYDFIVNDLGRDNWPDDNTFREGWLKYKLHRTQKARIVYIFKRLNEAKGWSDTPDTALENPTVESIGTEKLFSLAKQDTLLIGNTTLLVARPFNSKTAWGARWAGIVKDDLPINRQMESDAPPKWSLEQIDERANKLFEEYAKDIWLSADAAYRGLSAQ